MFSLGIFELEEMFHFSLSFISSAYWIKLIRKRWTTFSLGSHSAGSTSGGTPQSSSPSISAGVITILKISSSLKPCSRALSRMEFLTPFDAPLSGFGNSDWAVCVRFWGKEWLDGCARVDGSGSASGDWRWRLVGLESADGAEKTLLNTSPEEILVLDDGPCFTTGEAVM